MSRLGAVLMMAVIVALTACGGDDERADDAATSSTTVGATSTAATPGTTTGLTTTSTEVPTTTSPEETHDAVITVVVSAIDAKNRSDLAGWLMAFEGGQRQGIPLFAEELLMNANQHWEIIEPCQVTGQATSGDTIVECLIVNTDDFWGVGQIYEPRVLRFHVNTDGKITTNEGVTDTNTFRSDRRDTFNILFHLWLSDAYPDAYKEMDPGSWNSSGPGFQTQNAEHMLLAIEYVEEFVAQSDVYPLDPKSP